MPRTFLLIACLLPLAGCGHDKIETYTIPRPPAPSEVRLLAAILDHGEDQWYIKLVGDAPAVDAQGEAFTDFVRSIRFTPKKVKQATWTTPKEWEEVPSAGRQGVKAVATFRTSQEPHAPLATVFRFGKKSPLLDNVNRWRRNDLGLPSLAEEKDLEKVVKRDRQAGEHNVTLVDMRGPGARRRRDPHAGMNMGDGPARGKPLSDEITYKTPPGWKDLGGRVAAAMGIRIPIHTELLAGEAKAAVNKQPVLGDLQQNVDRWRGQVGLQAGKMPSQPLTVGGAEGRYYDIAGPEKRLLIVIVQRPGVAWTFKLLGPSPAVAANKDAFEAFVKSVQFKGAKR